MMQLMSTENFIGTSSLHVVKVSQLKSYKEISHLHVTV